MGEKEWKCRSRQCQCEEESLMPIVPVSLPDSQAPPPDESVGPIPGRRATSTVSQTVGPQCGHIHCGPECGARVWARV